MRVPDKPLINTSGTGLFCEPGNFHIDPWGPADTAVVTHAHADHARPGSRRYLA
ncbi:MAG: DNA ligase-associated DEXH box helicase, partial [Gammaproteobacteria bacterium]